MNLSMLSAKGQMKFMANLNQYEVAYALVDKQVILPVESEKALTAIEAVEASAVREMFPELKDATLKLGVFGKVVKPDTSLYPGDRVEIYRPLIADPKEARKKRAAEGKSMKKGQR